MSPLPDTTPDVYLDPESTLGQRLWMARKVANVSREDLRREAGVAGSTAKAAEDDKRTPQAGTIAAYARLTRITEDRLLFGDRTPQAPVARADESQLDRIERMVAATLTRLDTAALAAVDPESEARRLEAALRVLRGTGRVAAAPAPPPPARG